MEELAGGRPGEPLVTRVAGRARAGVLARVAGVLAERGGSRLHRAALA